MANDYKLQLSIALDTSSLKQSQIDTIAKNYSFKLKISPDFGDFEKQLQNFKSELGQLQQQIKNTAPSGKGAVLFDEAKNNQILANLQSKMDAIKASATKVIKEGMTTVDVGNGETLTRSTIQYSDSVGKVRTATLEWKKNQEGVAEAVKLTQNYLDKSQQSYDKMSALADKFLDKSKKLGSSKEVTEGVDLSHEIQSLTLRGNLYGLNEDETARLDVAYKRLQTLDSTVKASGKNLQNWSTEIGVAIKRTIEWAASVGLVYGALNQLKQGIQYVSDLNKEMTAIQIVTGMNSGEINKLASDYNGLAKELGATTEEVAKGSAEWFRQGKTVEETEQMMKSTLMMAKLGNIDTAQATEYLTSTLNGYKMSAEDAVTVVDKLTAVDNATATSVAELASALQKTSNIAAQSGVSFDQLVSYIK